MTGQLGKSDDPLAKLAATVDFEPSPYRLVKALKRLDRAKGGRSPNNRRLGAGVNQDASASGTQRHAPGPVAHGSGGMPGLFPSQYQGVGRLAPARATVRKSL